MPDVAGRPDLHRHTVRGGHGAEPAGVPPARHDAGEHDRWPGRAAERARRRPGLSASGAVTVKTSVLIPTTGDIATVREHAAMADQLGYDSINCSHIAARDSFTTLAGLAHFATSVTLATAVAPIYHRSPASMAQTAATVDDLSGGRFRLGPGTGHRATMGGWHGQDIGNPVAEMREYVALVRSLLAGSEPLSGLRWNSTFAFNGFKARADIPIYLAGLSPAMLRLAGEIADGVVLWACPASYVQDVVTRGEASVRGRAGQGLDGFD